MRHLAPNLSLGSLARILGSIVTCLWMIVAIGRSQEIRGTGKVPELHSPRPVSVADAIQMTQFGDFSYKWGWSFR